MGYADRDKEIGAKQGIEGTAGEKIQAGAMLFLRISLGLLMIVWGLHKYLDPEHSQIVIKTHYFQSNIEAFLIRAFGMVQTAFGVVVVTGYLRSVTHPLLVLGTATTLIAVFPSIVDPWGWYLKGTNPLFFPSLIVFAAALTLWTNRRADRFALDNTALFLI